MNKGNRYIERDDVDDNDRALYLMLACAERTSGQQWVATPLVGGLAKSVTGG